MTGTRLYSTLLATPATAKSKSNYASEPFSGHGLPPFEKGGRGDLSLALT
jgi:hypothetical protein